MLVLALSTSSRSHAEDARWFKGNTHTHSLWSDGNDFPEMIAGFYKEHGYHFLVLSDHNVLSRGERWMKVSTVEKRRKVEGPTTLGKYLGAFGEDGVELRGEGKEQQVRIKSLQEILTTFEEPGAFLFIEGEEITDRFEKHEIHTNALNVDEAIPPQHGDSVRATMRNNLRAGHE